MAREHPAAVGSHDRHDLDAHANATTVGAGLEPTTITGSSGGALSGRCAGSSCQPNPGHGRVVRIGVASRLDLAADGAVDAPATAAGRSAPRGVRARGGQGVHLARRRWRLAERPGGAGVAPDPVRRGTMSARTGRPRPQRARHRRAADVLGARATQKVGDHRSARARRRLDRRAHRRHSSSSEAPSRVAERAAAGPAWPGRSAASTASTSAGVCGRAAWPGRRAARRRRRRWPA